MNQFKGYGYKCNHYHWIIREMCMNKFIVCKSTFVNVTSLLVTLYRTWDADSNVPV